MILSSLNAGEFKIVEYNTTSRKMIIEFLDTGCIREVLMANAIQGQIKDPMRPTVYGKGFIGIGEYSTKQRKLYDLWVNMLERCYSPLFLKRQPSYIGCKVVKRWHSYQAFCADIVKMPNWNTRNYHLDKDLRVPGNKKYGPKYCSFVPRQINQILVNCKSKDAYSKSKLSSKRKDIELSLRKYKRELHSEVVETLSVWLA